MSTPDAFEPHAAPVPEPLPADVPAVLRRLDARLAAHFEAVRRRTLPEGLETRTLAAMTGRDPLELEPALHVVDRALGNAVAARAMEGAPQGLEARILAATAPALAARAARHAAEAPVVAGRLGRRPSWTSRLAVAASFAVVAVTGWWSTLHLTQPTGLQPGTVAVAEPVLVNDLSWHVADEVAAMDDEVAYLLETGGMRSTHDVTDEIESLFGELLADPRP